MVVLCSSVCACFVISDKSVPEMAGVKRKLQKDFDLNVFHKELDEVLCPICMEHPHNAVLLRCSSHEKGCRSYICDTSYRHSNCLDQFKKLRDDTTNSETNLAPGTNISYTNNVDYVDENGYHVSTGTGEEPLLAFSQDHTENLESTGESVHVGEADMGSSSDLDLNLKCPLCRGAVLKFEVVEAARQYLNMKKRSCSRESCAFSGNYRQLRIHARADHPTTRPSDVDPSRERAWRRLEWQSEINDIVSAIRSAIPGMVVVGDYAIENTYPVDSGSDVTEAAATPSWATLILFQMIALNDGEARHRSRAPARHRRPSGAAPRRRSLWGENLLGLQADDEDSNDDLHILVNTDEDDNPIPRRRQRSTRSRSDNES